VHVSRTELTRALLQGINKMFFEQSAEHWCEAVVKGMSIMFAMVTTGVEKEKPPSDFNPEDLRRVTELRGRVVQVFTQLGGLSCLCSIWWWF
jgi:phage terminase large subunit-like protein